MQPAEAWTLQNFSAQRSALARYNTCPDGNMLLGASFGKVDDVQRSTRMTRNTAVAPQRLTGRIK